MGTWIGMLIVRAERRYRVERTVNKSRESDVWPASCVGTRK